MRALLALPFVLWGACACAANSSTTEGYLAAKSAAEAKLKKAGAKGGGDKLDAQEKALHAALEKRLRALVGIKAPKGFGGKSSMSPEGLSAGEIGTDSLDGIVYESSNGQGRVLVTSLDLLRHWLEKRHADKDTAKDTPAEPDEALDKDSFFTFAVSPDASVNDFAQLPVKSPPGVAKTVAKLVLVTQDSTAYPPSDMTVAVVKSDTVLIALVPAKPKPQPIAACQTTLDGMRRKSNAALQRYNASKQDDTKSFDLYTKIEGQGAEAFRQCWTKEEPHQLGFTALAAQAQNLVDSLAAAAPLGE